MFVKKKDDKTEILVLNSNIEKTYLVNYMGQTVNIKTIKEVIFILK